MKCDKPKKGNQVMVRCSTCFVWCHKQCSSIQSSKQFQIERINNTWKCHNCKGSAKETECSICSETDKRKVLLECSRCLKKLHRQCHKAEFPNYNCEEVSWQCANCYKNNLVSDYGELAEPMQDNEFRLPKGLKIGHINVRDLMSKNKLDEVKLIIHKYKFDVFCISETWLWNQIDDSEIHISGYHMLRMDRHGIK